MKHGKVLVILPYSPNNIRIRSLQNLTDLSLLFEVDLIYCDDGGIAQIPAGVNILQVVDNRSKVARALRVLLGVIMLKPITYQFYHCLGLRKIVRSLNLDQYIGIFVERLPIHEIGLPEDSAILDLVDCFTDQVRQLRRAASGIVRWLYLYDSLVISCYERRMCNYAKRVLVTTAGEAEKLSVNGVIKPVIPFLHKIQIDPLESPFERRNMLFLLSFHGKLSYKPNLLALQALNDTIINALGENITIQILGKTTDWMRTRFPLLRFLDYVENLRDNLQCADLSVFPIVVAVGIQNKVLESLAAGVPAIVTPEIIQGIPAPDAIVGRGLFVSTIEGMAVQILRYLQLTLAEKREIQEDCLAYIRRINNTELRLQSLKGVICDK